MVLTKKEPRSVSFVASAKAGAGVQALRPQFWMPASRAHDGEVGGCQTLEAYR